ncbi:hypothetical protein Tco_0418683 [Tanacetum coccineum]
MGSQSARTQDLDETIELTNEHFDGSNNSAPTPERQSDNKRKDVDFVQNNNGQQPTKPSRGKMNTSKQQNVAYQSEGQCGQLTKGIGCFECGAPGHSREIVLRCRIRMEEMWMHKGLGFMQLGRQKRGEMLEENPDANIVNGSVILTSSYQAWNSKSDLIPGAAHRSSSSLSVGFSELKEVSEQLQELL